MSLPEVFITQGDLRPSQAALGKRLGAVSRKASQREQVAHERAVTDAVRLRCPQGGVRHVAALAHVDDPSLTEVVVR